MTAFLGIRSVPWVAQMEAEMPNHDGTGPLGRGPGTGRGRGRCGHGAWEGGTGVGRGGRPRGGGRGRCWGGGRGTDEKMAEGPAQVAADPAQQEEGR